jgi:hypothetical protein
MPTRRMPNMPRRRPRTKRLRLPHERDASPDTTAPEPDPMIVQAKRDLDAGLVDTDLRTTPGLDAEQRERLLAEEARASGVKSQRAARRSKTKT